jgi:acyl phosphate:glycerol-3-phosphate acyltransferase
MILAILAIILSYIAGSIPFAYIVVKLMKGTDIRNVGSGNVGFTNATRSLGIGKGLIVLFADAGKGVAAVLAISKLGMIQDNSLLHFMPVICGLAAIIGHIWTVFLKFKGGKGVATSLGIFISIHWIAGIIALAVWLIIVAITRYVSLGSILMCIAFIVVSFVTGTVNVTYGVDIWAVRIMAIVVTLIVTYKHRDNIQRLIKGEERKFGKKE